MKQKDTKDLLKVFDKISKKIEEVDLSEKQMLNEIKAMSLKIKTNVNNLNDLSKKRAELIKTIWKIAKTEELVFVELKKMALSDQKSFLEILEKNLLNKYKVIKGLDDSSVDFPQNASSIVGIEIYKEDGIKNKTIN